MGLALKEADKAFALGEFPVGCVVVQEGVILSVGSRRGTAFGLKRFSEIDHAEIRALKQIEKSGFTVNPESSVLFCTMEPCLMCFGAIIFSGIKTIVYAYEDVMGGGTGLSLDHLPPLYRDSNIRIVPGVLRKKSLDLFGKFFKNNKKQYWENSLLEEYTLAQAAALNK